MTWSRRWVRAALGVAALAALVGIGVTLAQSGGSGGLPNGPATKDQVLRGRYLVTAVASCADCHGGHSPADPAWLAGYNPKSNPEGEFQVGPATVYAKNITPDKATGIGDWTPQQIFTVLKTGHDDQGEILCPPMPWPNFRNLTDADRWAIVAYVTHVKPVSNQVPDPVGPNNTPVDCAQFYPPQLPPLPPYPAPQETAVQ